jgi:hypothetical protein
MCGESAASKLSEKANCANWRTKTFQRIMGGYVGVSGRFRALVNNDNGAVPIWELPENAAI